MQHSLLNADWQSVPLVDADVRWLPQALPEHQHEYATLCDELAWDTEVLTLFGREHAVPRLMAWYGDADARYRYSGVTHQPLPWTPTLQRLRALVEALCGVSFNSVLANWYRDGQDCMGRHSDDEPELGPTPMIASLSLGADRRFGMKHKQRKELDNWTVSLNGGSLLLMAGPTQRYWQHWLPRTRKPVAGRINLTFRQILYPTP